MFIAGDHATRGLNLASHVVQIPKGVQRANKSTCTSSESNEARPERARRHWSPRPKNALTRPWTDVDRRSPSGRSSDWYSNLRITSQVMLRCCLPLQYHAIPIRFPFPRFSYQLPCLASTINNLSHDKIGSARQLHSPCFQPMLLSARLCSHQSQLRATST